MKWIIGAAMVILLGFQCIAQNRPESKGGRSAASHPSYSITLTNPTNPVKVGVPIEIVVTVTNETNGDLHWNSPLGKDSIYESFKFLLTKNGREAPTTFFHRKVSGRQRAGDPNEVAGGSSITLSHPPGKMFEIPIDLTRLYEITEPGQYTLKVSRYDEVSKTTFHSNTLTLEIQR
jgi:hypothetical protein